MYIHCKSLVTMAVSQNDDIGNYQLSDPELSMYTVDSTAKVYTLDSTASLKVCVIKYLTRDLKILIASSILITIYGSGY